MDQVGHRRSVVARLSRALRGCWRSLVALADATPAGVSARRRTVRGRRRLLLQKPSAWDSCIPDSKPACDESRVLSLPSLRRPPGPAVPPAGRRQGGLVPTDKADRADNPKNCCILTHFLLLSNLQHRMDIGDGGDLTPWRRIGTPRSVQTSVTADCC